MARAIPNAGLDRRSADSKERHHPDRRGAPKFTDQDDSLMIRR